ncbi:hypothetical protein [Cellulomonas cellasea]|uniref:Uncharacterized protein n=2 Tax=Cellulomonas cellasea TaxID=43670 RepID=A0A0A0B936_9CELL|nr:hypothetical protein [Cellulomonas cellasea]KGM02672.1 hypothetical protein Q760_12170 [Cellulomonas cellasea DSM 20118]GEA86055.1 hypothetical protein CCE01nite_00040 [Cellulomonas cellasea]
MTAWQAQLRRTALAHDLEEAHRYAVGAASAGLRDAGLGPVRLTGTAVPLLADAAVTSATPFVRAPLLARLSRVRRLHSPSPATGPDLCPTCRVPAPCPTTKELDQ